MFGSEGVVETRKSAAYCLLSIAYIYIMLIVVNKNTPFISEMQKF